MNLKIAAGQPAHENIIDALIEHEAALRYFLTRKVGCAHTSADLVQRIAEKLLRQKQQPVTDNARAYLYRAATCEAVSYRRSEHRRSSYETDCVYLQDEFDGGAPDRSLAAEESLRLIHEALDTLPSLTREIFLLYRVKGVKQCEIAAQLGVSLSTVEKRLAAALKHCRHRLTVAATTRKHGRSTATRVLSERLSVDAANE